MISKIALFGIVAATLFSITIGIHSVDAAPVTFNLTKSKNPGPGFGDEKIGTVSIDTKDNKTYILANLSDVAPSQDKVFEGWLVDAGGSNYKLSLGQFTDNTLQFAEKLVNPYTYKQFIVTQEPPSDKDPNAADTYGGVELPVPYGQ
jgi:hypothetical protein